MNVLFTGASSRLGVEVLSHVLGSAKFEEVSCTTHQRKIPLQSPKLRQQALDLNANFNLDASVPRIDLLIHLAGVTHARDPEAYRRVNFEGSLMLVEQARARGCRQMFYVSTRCVGPKERKMSCGPYADSKRALEDALLKMDWDSLVIVRPAEIYGAGGAEGIDQFIHLARTWRVVPMIFGDPRLRFAPLHYGDFVRIAAQLLDSMPRGPHIYELCGPEILDGRALAKKLSRKFGALPIPMWYPMLEATLQGLRAIGVSVIAPDQIDRLLGDKSAEVPDPALGPRSGLTSL